MKENEIRKLIRLVEESEIESLEVSSWGSKIKITQRLAHSPNGEVEPGAVMRQVVTALPAAAPAAATQAAPAEEVVEEDTGRLVAIKSPMVGTFYAAPAPDADSYVSLNEKIAVGQVVCIVEAMKLMNEIESEVSGRVAKILIENAQPVEYGKTLFLIDPQG